MLDDFTFKKAKTPEGFTWSDQGAIDLAEQYIPASYRGLDRFVARKQIVADLEEADLLDKTEKHKLKVPRGDRTHVIIEPMLTDQWFVAMSKTGKEGKSITEQALECVASGEIKFHPENWVNTYNQWLNNIQDWCISRQLWWGHQIPAWYGDDGRYYVAHDEAEAKQLAVKDGYGGNLKRDDDVLDTWFSSALWPFSTLDWTGDNAKDDQNIFLQKYLPSSVLVTGFDIIFFWVARMVMMTKHITGKIPFRDVYVHGLIRDAEGHKMSKSKGNVLDPIDLIDGIALDELVKKRTTGLMNPNDAPKIEKRTRKEFPNGIPAFGTDALRFTFASLASPGRDIKFDMQRCEGYRNFCNKLWNAARFVLMNCAGKDVGLDESLPLEFSAMDRWMISMLQQAEAEMKQHFADYRFDMAARTLYELVWNTYCDWYVELSKTTLNDDGASAAEKRGTLRTLLANLEMLLRLLHPFMPFITEELWHRVAPRLNRQNETIMLQPYPAATDLHIDKEAVAEISWLKAFILGVRRIRAERDIPPARPLAVSITGGSDRERKWLQRNHARIMSLARVESITPVKKEPRDAVAELAGEMTLLVPLADLIDPRVELERLEKELNKLKNDRERTAKKLDNESFIYRAPEEIVDKERRRLEEVTANIARLERQHKRIKDLVKQGV
jgi:valyl-tRNA synthetase